MFFEDRVHAGRVLAEKFPTDRDFSSWTVVGLARGGVIVAREVAAAIRRPLRAMCVEDHKFSDDLKLVLTSLGPGQMIQGRGEKRGCAFTPDVSAIQHGGVRELWEDMRRRAELYHGGRMPTYGKRVIVCDDGLVSGDTALTAIAALRHLGVQQFILAIPVVPRWISQGDRGFELVTWRVTQLPRPTTGKFYFSFPNITDDEVVVALHPYV